MDAQINKEDNIFNHAPSLSGLERDKLFLRSEAVQEIISKKPGFLEKWAMLVFLVILLLLIAGSWFIKYPDTIEAVAYLTANNAPKEIIPRQEGRLVKLLVNNDDQVRPGQMIGWIESTGSHADVIDLSRQLDSGIQLLTTNQTEKVSRLFKQQFRNLGELQGTYQQFITAWQQFNDYLVNGFYSHKKALLQNDIVDLHKMNQTILKQKDLTEQDIKLAEESFKMNSTLSDEKVLSNEEYRAQKSKFVNKEMAIPTLTASLLTNENLQREKQKEINQLEHDIAQQKVVFQEALQTLKSASDDWIRKYILQSPIEGKIAFMTPIQENQFVQQGKLLGYINPSGNLFYAQINLPQSNFGKVNPGLQVQLRFDAYPYQEFGFVMGSLNYISTIATDSGFLATIRLDHGLLTNHNIPIQYKSRLKAQAIVITQNMRLLQRLYYNLVKTTSTNK
jgi:multidrug resistance efflux pump